jgi:hypothetical protein
VNAGRKQFFFEKKNQKTFVCLPIPPGRHRAIGAVPKIGHSAGRRACSSMPTPEFKAGFTQRIAGGLFAFGKGLHAKQTKVFWFFFSKKNYFLPYP